jgi:hypothetical protein
MKTSLDAKIYLFRKHTTFYLLQNVSTILLHLYSEVSGMGIGWSITYSEVSVALYSSSRQ